MLSTSIRKNSFVQDYEITMIRKIKLFDLLRVRWTAFLANSGRLRMDDRNLGRQFIIICEFPYKHFVEKICVIEFFFNIVFFVKWQTVIVWTAVDVFGELEDSFADVLTSFQEELQSLEYFKKKKMMLKFDLSLPHLALS